MLLILNTSFIGAFCSDPEGPLYDHLGKMLLCCTVSPVRYYLSDISFSVPIYGNFRDTNKLYKNKSKIFVSYFKLGVVKGKAKKINRTTQRSEIIKRSYRQEAEICF